MLNTERTQYTKTDGFKIMIARIHAGLSQLQLAKTVGISQSKMSMIERNETNATEDEVKRIRKALEAAE